MADFALSLKPTKGDRTSCLHSPNLDSPYLALTRPGSWNVARWSGINLSVILSAVA